MGLLAGCVAACGGESGGDSSGGGAANAGGASTTSAAAQGGGPSGGSGGSTPVDACSGSFEGHGRVAMGGTGGDIFVVTSMTDGGPGSLREGVESQTGPRTIVFELGGTIALSTRLVIRAPFLTIDGCSAPAPGVTITSSSPDEGILMIGGTHDIVIRNLRIVGLWTPPEPHIEGTQNIVIDGDSGPDQIAARIVLDHLSILGGNDSALDVWGEVADLTVSWSFLLENQRGGILSHYPEPYQVRQRISYHHNAYARNTERNPQIRADVRDLDFVNNVIFEWGYFDAPSGYGIRIRNDGTEPPVHGNFVNNAFLSSVQPEQAFLNEGTGAELYLEGNLFPPEFSGDPSTTTNPLPVPQEAAVTTWTAAELATMVLPTVGVRDREAAEQAVLDEIAGRF
jgi:pectate lyase